MNDSIADQNSAEFKKLICRRVPIKLKQFARLLSDLSLGAIDPVRVKAMESQIRKTRETCDEYGVESTASLLGHIISQLNLDADTLDTQRPLIKRFVDRLESHAERLQLGQINTATHQAVKEAQKCQTDPVEQSADSASELAASEAANSLDHVQLEAAPPEPEEQPPTEKEHQPAAKATPSTAPETSFNFSTSISKSSSVQASSILTSDHELTIYWCIDDDNSHGRVKEQMIDFGYYLENESIETAIEKSAGDSKKVVIAKLEDFDDNISQAINQTSHLIVFSEHDTLQNRLKGIRLGSTLFFSHPVDTIKLMEYLDTLEHETDDAPFRIAVMEDSKAQAKFNQKVLNDAGYETCIVIDPMELLNALSSFDPEVIFMDMQMPGCNGIELTQVLRQIERFSTVPIVFLSAEENHEKQKEAMTSGGTAFITKPVKKDQMLFMAELYARRTRHLQPHLARDFQTGLNTSSLLHEQLAIEAERAMRQNDTMYLALLEINNLLDLNKQHGYVFGERAMQQLARLLRQRLRKTDCIGFFDGQRIGVILSHCNDHEAEAIMSYLAQTFATSPVGFEQQSVSVSLSVGLSQLGRDADIQRLVKRSEAALEQCKQSENYLIWAHENRSN